MPDNSSEQEPSIEEILASIRDIISDDDEDSAKDGAGETPAVEEPAPAPEPAPEPEPAPVPEPEEDVLALTEDDLVEEPAPVPEPAPEPEPEMEIEMRDLPEEATPEPEPEEVAMPSSVAPVPSDIMSSGTQAAAMGSISKLASKMPINNSRSYDGVTLEDIVREMLHPMLREWMDDNLPPMVERIVQKELEKLARRAFDE